MELQFKMEAVTGRDPQRYRRPVLEGTVNKKPFRVQGPMLDWNLDPLNRVRQENSWKFLLCDQARRYSCGKNHTMKPREEGGWYYA